MLFAQKMKEKQHVTPIVLTDDAVKALFKRTRLILQDGPVAVEGVAIGWQRHKTGLLNCIVLNPLTGRRFLYGPDLAAGGKKVREIAKL